MRLVASDFEPDCLKQLLQRSDAEEDTFAQPAAAWRLQAGGCHEHTGLQVAKDGRGIAGRREAAKVRDAA